MRERFFYDGESDTVVVPAAKLAGFSFPGRGLPFENAYTDGETVGRDVPVHVPADEFFASAVIVGEIFEVTKTPRGDAVCVRPELCRTSDTPANLPEETAALAVLGYVYTRVSGEEKILLRMIIPGKTEDGDRSYEYEASAALLEKLTRALFERAAPYLTHVLTRGREGLPALKNLPFPYKEPRDAQREFISSAYRAIKHSSRLLVSAPTGTGKTVSALYPALCAIGAGAADKVFCLCAKTTIGRAFVEACALMAKYAPHLRCVVISSKERICPDKGRRHAGGCSMRCPLFAPVNGVSAAQRLLEAGEECLGVQIITAEVIADAAAKHSVCPHELSLLVSEYADVIVCDYNYAFDFRMRLRRYFDDDTGAFENERYVFLADEVHNLPKRAADTYSAELSLGGLEVMRTALEPLVSLPEYKKVSDTAKALAQALESVRETALRDAESHTVAGEEIKAGFVSLDYIPEKLATSAAEYKRALSSCMRRFESVPDAVSGAWDSASRFCHVCELFDKNHTFFASAVGDEFYVRLICLDPSPLLDRAMSVARSVVFFSATLTPISYYADILGCSSGDVLELDSPFPPENLCPVVVDSVSLKMSERLGSIDTVVECIASVTDAHPGNYLAFFPSFDYMEKVLRTFREAVPDVEVLAQGRSMRAKDRADFLARFTSPREEGTSLVGFTVIGGIFSEGIDLPGDALVGVIIAGTGMPAITSERNIMKEYFDRTREEGGMDYAYVYPGFNAVQQAAGRVIRSESDRGVLVLIDSRYSEPGYYRLFPKWWRHVKFTGDPFSLGEILSRFWEAQEELLQ